MAKFIAIPPENIAKAKELYEGTSVPVRDIALMLGIGVTTFLRRVKAWGWKPRNARLADYDAAAKAGLDLDAISKVVAPELATAEQAGREMQEIARHPPTREELQKRLEEGSA